MFLFFFPLLFLLDLEASDSIGLALFKAKLSMSCFVLGKDGKVGSWCSNLPMGKDGKVSLCPRVALVLIDENFRLKTRIIINPSLVLGTSMGIVIYEIHLPFLNLP